MNLRVAKPWLGVAAALVLLVTLAAVAGGRSGPRQSASGVVRATGEELILDVCGVTWPGGGNGSYSISVAFLNGTSLNLSGDGAEYRDMFGRGCVQVRAAYGGDSSSVEYVDLVRNGLRVRLRLRPPASASGG